jgi:hypothetical protein
MNLLPNTVRQHRTNNHSASGVPDSRGASPRKIATGGRFERHRVPGFCAASPSSAVSDHWNSLRTRFAHRRAVENVRRTFRETRPQRTRAYQAGAWPLVGVRPQSVGAAARLLAQAPAQRHGELSIVAGTVWRNRPHSCWPVGLGHLPQIPASSRLPQNLSYHSNLFRFNFNPVSHAGLVIRSARYYRVSHEDRNATLTLLRPFADMLMTWRISASRHGPVWSA